MGNALVSLGTFGNLLMSSRQKSELAIALLTVILKAGKSAQNFVNAHCKHYPVKGLVVFDILGVKNGRTG